MHWIRFIPIFIGLLDRSHKSIINLSDSWYTTSLSKLHLVRLLRQRTEYIFDYLFVWLNGTDASSPLPFRLWLHVLILYKMLADLITLYLLNHERWLLLDVWWALSLVKARLRLLIYLEQRQFRLDVVDGTIVRLVLMHNKLTDLLGCLSSRVSGMIRSTLSRGVLFATPLRLPVWPSAVHDLTGAEHVYVASFVCWRS